MVGTLKNFVPERMVRATGTMMRMNIDDGDIFIAEFANGAIGSVQTSFVTVGNYPGIEVRLYGSQGRDHLPAGRGVRHRRDDQDRHAGRCRVQGARDPAALLSRGRPSARVVEHALLRQPDQGLPRRADHRHRGQPGQLRRRRRGAGDHQRGRALAPQRRWVDLPLATDCRCEGRCDRC